MKMHCFKIFKKIIFGSKFSSNIIISITVALLIFIPQEISGHQENITDSSTNPLNNSQTYRKCCDLHEHLEIDDVILKTFHCVQNADFNFTWESFRIFKSPDDELHTRNMFENETLISGFPTCQNNKELSVLLNDGEIWFQTLVDGQVKIGLHFWFWQIWLPVVENDYCLDILKNNESFGTETLLYCNIQGFDRYMIHKYIYWISFVLSTIFLFLTLCIYWVVKVPRNMLQISYFVALLLFYSSESFRIYLKMNGLEINPSKFCVYQSIFGLYIELVCSVTVLVVGFDILWKFWKMHPAISMTMSWSRIFCLIIIPWGLPLVGLSLGYTYRYFKGYMLPNEDIGILKFGHSRCSSSLFQLVLLFQSTTFLLNIIYFILTLYVVFDALFKKRRSKVKNSSTTKFATESFKVLMKISLLMGVTLLLTASEGLWGYYEPFAWYWVFGRIFLFGLQGLWIFMAFGCNKRNREYLVLKKNKIMEVIFTEYTNSSRRASNSIAQCANNE